MTKIQFSRKQKLAYDLLSDPTVVELDYGGGAGGAKTFLVCMWAVLELRKYPGIRIGLGRKELTRLKQTTVVSLLRKVHPLLNVNISDYHYNENKGLITYRNGSQIQLIDLAYQPSDPDFDTLGSLELTHAIIEEAGEIRKKAKSVLSSRVNRYMNDKYNIVGKTVLTQNPSQNFTKDEYYRPYIQQGGGDYQKWRSGEVYVNGLIFPAYKAFVQSLVTDNPFIDRNYIERLKALPPQEKKRLLEGNWDYLDDDNKLIQSFILDRSFTGFYQTGRKAIGVDVADSGKDQTIITLIDNGCVVNQWAFKAIESPIPNSQQTALEIIRIAQTNGMSAKDAMQIGVDVIGVGVGVRDFMKSRGWHIYEYIAGAKATAGYRNLRSESYWTLAQGLEAGTLQIYNDLSSNEELRTQLLSHEVKTEDRVISILGKDKIKESIGRSPDHADSLCIAYWVYAGVRQKTKILF